MLPEAHRNKLWKMRPSGFCGTCGPCEFCNGTMEDCVDCDPWVNVGEEWQQLTNLAIALICRMEYGGHGCPEELRDDDGFCWGCGCHDVPHVYEVSEQIIKKFGLRAVRA